MRLIEGFGINHDATIVKELQGRFEVKGTMGSDAIVGIFPSNELRIEF
jgi:hypothetical protein